MLSSSGTGMSRPPFLHRFRRLVFIYCGVSWRPSHHHTREVMLSFFCIDPVPIIPVKTEVSEVVFLINGVFLRCFTTSQSVKLHGIPMLMLWWPSYHLTQKTEVSELSRPQVLAWVYHDEPAIVSRLVDVRGVVLCLVILLDAMGIGLFLHKG